MKNIKLGLVYQAVAFLFLSSAFGETLKPFGDELAFLKKNTEVVVLSGEGGQNQVVVSPLLQGRVLTSTAAGLKGQSYGWINRELIASKKTLKHINPYGGEDRFWLGPEGGQFSIFFPPGAKFDLDHWQTPPAFDSEGFRLVLQEGNRVVMKKDISLTNYSGAKFEVGVKREIRLLSGSEAWGKLRMDPVPGIKMVAYESGNRITNQGEKPWLKDTGLLSVWILGMFSPSDRTTVVIPFRPGNEETMGPVVNDRYFGKVPPDRLVIRDKVLFFSGDGKKRGKIGIPPKRALPVIGSYDADHGILTLVQFTQPEGTSYVNSMWEIQEDPFGGDVSNSYNDGPPAPGQKPLGPFYELESSSPAAALKPGQSLSHVHRTFHLEGPEESLNSVAKALLGVGIPEIKSALKK